MKGDRAGGAGVPGIGERRSKRLMEIFGSVEAMLGQSAEELQKKSGLPRATAATLLARLAERYSRSPGEAEGGGGLL